MRETLEEALLALVQAGPSIAETIEVQVSEQGQEEEAADSGTTGLESTAETPRPKKPKEPETGPPMGRNWKPCGKYCRS
ncbi:MAG: hypothetical protein AMJ56_11480 [Anaerolineae bacterium SG8_19]|nr:MAG: hypothetical protein AMJ56_11480 [Anaerolineae bacterium SG8_19]